MTTLAPDPLLTTFDTRKRADQVRDSIVNLIRTRGLQPGDQLPTERELMDRLGVGRSSVREALNSLVGLGAVEARRGKGFYVNRLSVQDVTKVVASALFLGSEVSWSLVEARSIIEAAAGRLAAKRHDAEDIQRLQQAVEQIRTAFAEGNVEAIVAADSAFHHALVQASHNDVLVQMLHSIEPWLVQQLKDSSQWRVRSGNDTYATAVGTHEVILRAIASRDADLAEKAVRKHIPVFWERVEIWPLT